MLTVDWFLGASPQTPWVGFAEFWASNCHLRSRTNAFCFFFLKKKNADSRLVSWGKPQIPPGSASPSFGHQTVFCEAEQMLFASFS
jgi:hypothetical protein